MQTSLLTTKTVWKVEREEKVVCCVYTYFIYFVNILIKNLRNRRTVCIGHNSQVPKGLVNGMLSPSVQIQATTMEFRSGNAIHIWLNEKYAEKKRWMMCTVCFVCVDVTAITCASYSTPRNWRITHQYLIWCKCISFFITIRSISKVWLIEWFRKSFTVFVIGRCGAPRGSCKLCIR